MIRGLGEGELVVFDLRRVDCCGMIVRKLCMRCGQKGGKAVWV